jgi:hypothetical protein
MVKAGWFVRFLPGACATPDLTRPIGEPHLMIVFPSTRCPECGTYSTGRICPSCREPLWIRTFHHRDPDTGKEAWADEFGALLSARGYILFKGDLRDENAPPVEFLYDRRPVEPIHGGHAWERCFDGAIVYSDDLDVPIMEDADTPRSVPLHWPDGSITWTKPAPAPTSNPAADETTARPSPDPSANGHAEPWVVDRLLGSADALWEQGAHTRAALLEFMADRESATFEEIGRHVHGDPHASDGAIRQNVSRANKDLEARGSPVVLRVSGAKVFKVPNPR